MIPSPPTDDPAASDDRYFGIVADALRVCLEYRPKFGQGSKAGLSLDEFQSLYQGDPFYNWFGLHSPLVYAAHKAAGGMTSLYRQIGIGCERLFRQVLQDCLGLTEEQANWSYTVPGSGGKKRTLRLDGRIRTEDLSLRTDRERVEAWVADCMVEVEIPPEDSADLNGAVFEVRQGYKSKDAKRQNADVANAANAYAHNYVPVVVLLSAQIDGDVADRYRAAKWIMLTGTLGGSPLDSTYVFCRDVVGYDLRGFFERNSDRIRDDVLQVVQGLLT